MMSNMMMTRPIAGLSNAPSTLPVMNIATMDQKNYVSLDKVLNWDILCSGDRRLENHTGNMRFQQILEKMRASFAAMESKTAKKKMVRDVHEYIQGYGGRFLRVEEATSQLRIMTTAESRNKISRCLRECSAPKKNQKTFIAEITELDVMCGRGGKANHHLGNKLYRKLVNEMKQKYRNTEDKDDKTELSRSIVDQVYEYGGRFVKKDAPSGRYYVLSKAEARIKTSQALRENRDSKSSASTSSDDDSDSDNENGAGNKAMAVASAVVSSSFQTSKPAACLDNASLDCCQALVSLSRSFATPTLTPKAA
ncbi:expressed unknown protein [Seminavis robusta]|uniref:DUF6824 domain-containing protein n=1 Tax=Seminavis robusta TaxID=568900 RepID=A0A9N8F325_9STRA|nr:expressed unknown protein [Seminavis robusta]|eukprot:Sro2960_g341000.1 n/a (309) ;mRNA; f:4809-5831